MMSMTFNSDGYYLLSIPFLAQEISRSESKHFVVLFRDAGLQYRGLYSFNPDKQEVLKIQGVGPRQLSDKMMEKFFKLVASPMWNG